MNFKMFGVFDVTKAFINQYLKEIYTRNHTYIFQKLHKIIEYQ